MYFKIPNFYLKPTPTTHIKLLVFSSSPTTVDEHEDPTQQLLSIKKELNLAVYPKAENSHEKKDNEKVIDLF